MLGALQPRFDSSMPWRGSSVGVVEVHFGLADWKPSPPGAGLARTRLDPLLDRMFMNM